MKKPTFLKQQMLICYDLSLFECDFRSQNRAESFTSTYPHSESPDVDLEHDDDDGHSEQQRHQPAPADLSASHAHLTNPRVMRKRINPEPLYNITPIKTVSKRKKMFTTNYKKVFQDCQIS